MTENLSTNREELPPPQLRITVTADVPDKPEQEYTAVEMLLALTNGLRVRGVSPSASTSRSPCPVGRVAVTCQCGTRALADPLRVALSRGHTCTPRRAAGRQAKKPLCCFRNGRLGPGRGPRRLLKTPTCRYSSSDFSLGSGPKAATPPRSKPSPRLEGFSSSLMTSLCGLASSPGVSWASSGWTRPAASPPWGSRTHEG